MEKKRLTLIFVLMVIFFGLYFAKSQNETAADIESITDEKLPVHLVKFYDNKTFLEGVDQAREVSKQNYHIKGGIIPHHLFPGFILADFFKRLSFQNPKTIILVGPNHYEKGNKALTSLYSWETPFGIVKPDLNLINALVSKNLLQVDEAVLPNDHAVSGSIPFIKYYIPEAKIVPILLKGGFSQKETEVLAENLEELVNNDAVVIAPVDFSHYLTSPQAKEKDEVTLKIMQDFDYPKLYLLNNDYLDSPPSIAVSLMLMQKLGSTNSEILFHTNSGELQKNNFIETTSYFSIAFHEVFSH